MSALTEISQFSSVIIAAAAFFGIVYALYVGRQILNQMQRSERLTRDADQREFFSRYDNDRMALERQIADLNIRLTHSLGRFEQVNHLILDGQQKQLASRSARVLEPESFLDSLSVDQDRLKVDPNLVFVLTPFHPSEERTYSAIIEALSAYGIRVVRGDEESAKGDILSHIIRQMLTARLIIANVSSRNPNVMYELGIAHALGKDVVMVANSDSDLPFDINSRRVLLYSNRDDLINKLRRELGRKMFEQS